MKYLSIKYWLELWLWTAPIFNNLLQNVNGKPISNMENNKNVSKLGETAYQNNDKTISCVHEAGHTVVTLNSKFKNNFQEMQFFPKNRTYYGATTSDEFFALSEIKNINNSDLSTLLHIDLAGFAAESLVFNVIFFTNIIDQGRVNISSDLQNYHDIYQKNFEIRNLKLPNEDSLKFLERQMNETIKIISNNKSLFEPIVKTCCLINYVNKEHANYILKYQELPIPLFTKTQIQAFTKVEIASFNQKQIASFTPKQISWFIKEQLIIFTLSQLQVLNTTQLQALTKEQIQALTPEQIAMFMSTQISRFTIEQLQNFTPAQIAALRPNQLQALTRRQIPKITKEQLKQFSEIQIQALTTSQIEQFIPSQIQALTPFQISWLTPQQLQLFTVTQIKVLTVSQIEQFIEKQISALTPEQLQTNMLLKLFYLRVILIDF